MARRRRLNDHPWCDADIQGVAAARLGGKQKRRAAVIVMGMSRSGTSLTTSIITKLLNPGGGDEKTVYMGSGAPYPADHANPNGYYERRDVISLDYGTLRTIEKGAWYNFPPGFAQHPTLLNYSGSPSLAAHQRRAFEEKAVPILADMDKRQPWVLKDVRFARMLPLWWPLLTSGAVCVIPYRNPLDVAASSILHSTRVWENYMSAALATTAALGCPTALVSYHDWTSGDARARRQLAGLHAFLRCAGVPGLTAQPSPGVLEQAVLTSATHTRDTASYQSQLSPSVRCLWERLRNGSALRHRPPCIVGGASVERLGTVR